MDINKVHFDETKQSQLPFVEMLINMGYRYIPTAEIMAERGGDTSKFILKNTAMEKLSEINGYEIGGEGFKFSEKDVREAIDELENIQFEGLIDTSKKIYSMIMPTSGGKTVRVTQNGKSVSKNFRFIDFENPENNDFAVAVEFEAMGKNGIRPDIVVFVNGIPFAVIENKKSSVLVDQAVSQQIRNQGAEYCPKLFVYPQLLVGANKEELKYGTTGTPNKFYASWKEKDVDIKTIDKKVSKVVAKKIDDSIYNILLHDLNGSIYGYKQNLERTITEQDRSVFCFLPKTDYLI